MKHETKTMHLFAGHGGGLLADLILGHTPVVAVEWDGYACQVLRERAADGWFSGLRVWEGDVSLFDPSEYTGSVDVIHAGFPCQDISVAGKQTGVSEGTRSGLYREVLRIAGVVRPRQLFLENVSAILSNGLGTVLGDLAALGYDCRWLCIRASDVGAPHHRDRWFLLANANGDRWNGWRCNWKERQVSTDKERDVTKAQSNGEQREFGVRKICEVLADSESGNGRSGKLGSENQTIGTSRTNQFRRSGAVDGSSSDFWTTEPELGRVANGIPHRVHRLKGLGNAQVPLQAATAYRLLGGL